MSCAICVENFTKPVLTICGHISCAGTNFYINIVPQNVFFEKILANFLKNQWFSWRHFQVYFQLNNNYSGRITEKSYIYLTLFNFRFFVYIGGKKFTKETEPCEMSNMSRVIPTFSQQSTVRGVEKEKEVKTIKIKLNFVKRSIKRKARELKSSKVDCSKSRRHLFCIQILMVK